MLQATVTGQQGLEKLLKKVTEALDEHHIAEEAGALLFNRIRTNFLATTDPDGVKWPQSKAAARRLAGKDKKYKGGDTLFRSGRLFRSLQLWSSAKNEVAISTDVPYGVFHNEGMGKTPRRRFLGFGDKDVDLAERLVLRRLKEGIK